MDSFVYTLLSNKISYKQSLEAYLLYRKNPKVFLESYPKFKELCADSYPSYEKEVMLAQKHKLVSFLLDDPYYPSLLAESPDAPLMLYSNYVMPPEGQKFIAIIGARSCSELGKNYARHIVDLVAKFYPGYTILTASVHGIASVVREQAALLGVPVVTVLGTGFENMHLYRSALPFTSCVSSHLCTTQPSSSDYIIANSILAGMSEKVIVVESTEKSGCMDVAKKALDYGHDVYTVFGPNLSESFSGNFALISSNIAADYRNLFPFPNV